MTEEDLRLVEDGLDTIREAIRFSSLSRSTLYELMDAGVLRFVKLGRSRRIPRRALLELVASHLVGGSGRRG